MGEVVSLCSCVRDNIHCLSRDDLSVETNLSGITEGNLAVRHSEDGVVLTEVNVLAGHDLRTALADDDFTDAYGVAIGTLNTQVFWV